jgi:hypothetical protein
MKRLNIASRIKRELLPLWQIAVFNDKIDVPYTVQKAKIMELLENSRH